MNIVVNAIPLLSPLTGIGRYTYEISKRLNNVTYYYGFYSNKIIVKRSKLKQLIEILRLKKIIRKFIKKASFNRVFDIYWEPSFIPIDINAKKVVTTIHDFSFLNEEWHDKERYDYFKKNFYKNIKKSDFIITVSEFIRQEAIKKLDIPKEKIKAIYLGIEHNKFYHKNLEREKFILFVGSIEPRKNLVNLLKAYDLLDDNLKQEYPLYLVGFKGWNNKKIMELIKKNNIRYFGFVEDTKLSELYNKTSLFIYPSLYEGFGLPPIEAMACGAPVLVSNISSIPEICKNYAFYCNPLDIYDICNQIKFLLENPDIRNSKTKKAIQYVKKFDWDITAKKHFEVFKKVL